jgi:phosphatidylinositol alpha-1,6-mannosyltransferase
VAAPDGVGGVLGLFPSIEETGGIQTSGRLAWDGILELGCYGGRAGTRPAVLFCYCGAGGGRSDPAPGSRPGTAGGQVHASSKGKAVLAALGRRWQPELVLVWHVGLLKLVPLFRAPRARVVLFLHGVEGWRRLSWLTQGLMRRVDLFLSNTDYTWRRFAAANPRYHGAPHQTVPLGVGAPLRGPAPAPVARPAMLMLSRLRRGEDYKGHRELIEAWPRVLARIPDAELWIAGEGDLRAQLEHLAAARGLEGSVRFWGWVSEAQKEALLSQCRCFALPSRGEGFGLVYLEAMRLGRPCLVSAQDAGAEVVRPPLAGLAADVHRPDELAQAVCRLLRPGEEWESWSAAAREVYERRYTARHFQERLWAAIAPLRAPAEADAR